jgi:2-hydroxychromene-2-carboxylate isomerase
MCYIKSTFSSEKFEEAWLALFLSLWEDHINITQTEPLAETLKQTKLFSDEEVTDILKAAGDKVWKDKLLVNTQKALDLGAFGAPWMMVRNGDGKEEPFFGSDRYVADRATNRKMYVIANFSLGFTLCGSIWVYRSRTLRLFLKGDRRLSCDCLH